MDYLNKNYDLNHPDLVAVFDEMSLWSSYFGQLLLRHIDFVPNRTVLDIGCGAGFPLFELAHAMGRSCHFTGLDIWKPALERARFKKTYYSLSNVQIIEGDASVMPFEDTQFDLIVSNLGINNFEQPQKVLSECFRVLKRGGKIALTSNVEGHFQEFYELFRQSLGKLSLEASLPDLDANIQHRLSPSIISQLLEEEGFQIVKLVEDQFQWRYLDGSAMLRHFLTRVGFLEGWRSVVKPGQEVLVFSMVEDLLNEKAAKEGEIRMTVPMVYVEGIKNT